MIGAVKSVSITAHGGTFRVALFEHAEPAALAVAVASRLGFSFFLTAEPDHGGTVVPLTTSLPDGLELTAHESQPQRHSQFIDSLAPLISATSGISLPIPATKTDIVSHPVRALCEDDVRRMLSGAFGSDGDLSDRDRTPSLGLHDTARWHGPAASGKAGSPPSGTVTPPTPRCEERADDAGSSPKGVHPLKLSPLALAISQQAAEKKESKFGDDSAPVSPSRSAKFSAVVAARSSRAQTSDSGDVERGDGDSPTSPLLQQSWPVSTSPGPSHGGAGRVRRMSSMDQFKDWLSRGRSGTGDQTDAACGERSPRTALNKQTAEMCDAVQRFNRLSTELANERTFLAWVRTCLAAIRTVFTYLVLHAMTSSEQDSLITTEVAMASLIVISAGTGAIRYYQLKSVINMADLPMGGFGRISMRPMMAVVVFASVSTAMGIISQQWVK